METYQILGIFVLFYTVIVILFTLFMTSFRLKYRKYHETRANKEISKVLNKLRGRMTILFPLKIISVVFIISWGILFLTFIDFVWEINILTTYFKDARTTITWIGTITSNQANYYLLILFVSTTIGGRGYWLIKDMTNVLSDTSLAVGPNGLKYQKEVF